MHPVEPSSVILKTGAEHTGAVQIETVGAIDVAIGPGGLDKERVEGFEKGQVSHGCRSSGMPIAASPMVMD